MEDARTAEPEEISRTLPAITAPDDHRLMEWTEEDGKPLVLVGSMIAAADAPAHYREWFAATTAFSYDSSTPYPWTRIGYTCTAGMGIGQRSKAPANL